MPQHNGATHESNRGRPGYAREDIIRTAVDEFNSRGYEATSMGILASRLGVSKSAIYHHISSKEEILVDAVNLALSALSQVMDDADQAKVNAGERLSLVISGATKVLCENPEQVTLLLRLRGNTEVELELMARRRNLTQRLINHVRIAQDEGSVRSDVDAALVGRLSFGLINSIVEWYHPSGSLSPTELSEIMPKLLFTGIETGAAFQKPAARG